MSKSPALPALDGLFDLACRDGVDIRPTLLRVLTDLYAQKPVHSAEEQAQYVELAGRLIEAVDEATRQAVATTLAGYPAAPEPILRALADAGAAPPAPAPHPPQPREPDLAELFFAASAEERRLILLNLEPVADAPAARTSPAADDVIHRLEAAALQHNTADFTRMLERALGVSPRLAERIARDASGEPIVVAAKALAMPAAVFQRILLFLDPAVGQSVARVYDLARLYDEMSPRAAQHMLAIWRQAGAPRMPAHQPLHYDDEQRGARAAATPSQQRATRARPPAASRIRSNGR